METEGTAAAKLSNPYVGPRPFEQRHKDLFFGRDPEISELLSLITAHRVLLIYAQSGAGKTSLVNAGLIPRLEAEGFEVLPTARVQGLIPDGIQAEKIANLYIFNALMSWAESQSDRQALKTLTLAGFLDRRQHRPDETGLPSPRVLIFDQFEELLTFYPERWKDRTDFFTQVADALVGSPLLLRESDLCDSSTLVTKLCDYHNPFSEYLREQFSPELQRLLYAHAPSTPTNEKLLKGLVDELNRLIQDEKLYTPASVTGISLAEATQKLAEQNPQGRERIRLNRLLVEEAYPAAIKKRVEGDPLLRVVFVIREDHLAQLDPYAALLPDGFQTHFRLERLGGEAALQAVKGPLNDTDRTFAAYVAEALVAELQKARTVTATGETAESEGQYVEPVQLQVVCRRLWASLPPTVKVIEPAHRQEFGNVTEALATFYEESLQATTKRSGVDEATLRRWFEATLITPMRTRSTVYRDEKQRTTGGIANTAIDSLEDHHIIRAENRAGIRWYELTHDRFIEPILAANRAWFETWRQTHRNPLTTGAREWQRLNKDEGSLFGGAQLDEAIAWAKQHTKELNELEQEFLDASVALRQRIAQEQAKNTRILRWLVAALVLALLVASGFWLDVREERNSAVSAEATARAAQETAEVNRRAAVMAGVRSDEANIQANIAKATAVAERDIATSQRLAAQAIANLQSDPQLALLLGVEAIMHAHTAEAKNALHDALLESHTRLVLRGHVDRINTMAFSANGHWLVTASEDGTARMWDIETGESFDPLPHVAGVLAAALSPTDDTLTTITRDGAVRRWAASTGNEVPGLDLDGAVSAVAFSEDGQILATGGRDGTTQVWNLGQVTQTAIWRGHAGSIQAIAISPDGTRVATASLDGTARLWDVAAAKEIARLTGRTIGVNVVAFSPDGHLLATADADGTAHLWDAASGREQTVLHAHDNSVTVVAFDPHSQKLATGSADRSVKLWDVATEELLVTLRGHGDTVNALNFSPDGLRLATASADGSARLWNAVTGELQTTLQGHSASVGVVRFSPNGDLLATAGADGTVRIWTATESEAQNILRGHEAAIYGVAFNPKGNLLATSSDDRTVRLWDMAASANTRQDRTLVTLRSESPFFSKVIFSPDGALLVAGDRNGATHLWDVAKALNGDPDPHFMTLRGHKGFVYGVAFNPNGNLLATGSGDGTARLWNLKRAIETRDANVKNVPEATGVVSEVVLSVCSQAVYGVAFSVDGSLLATSCDGTIRLWDIANVSQSSPTEALVVLGTRGDTVIDVAFSYRLLAAGSADGTVHLWDYRRVLATGATKPITALRGHSDLVVGVAFNPQGTQLATTSTDGTFRLWDVLAPLRMAGAGAEIAVQQGFEGGVYGVAFNPTGEVLAAGGGDRSVRLWTVGTQKVQELLVLACQRAVRNLTQSEWETYFVNEAYRQTCTNLLIHPSVMAAMIVQAQTQVRQGQVDEALATLRKAKALNPNLTAPEAEVASLLVEHGRELTSQGNVTETLAVLKKAKALDPMLEERQPLEMARLYHTVCRQASEQGNVSPVMMESCQHAVTLAVTTDDAYLNFNLCKYRSVVQLAAVVEPACERASVLAQPLALGVTVTSTVEAGSGGIWTFASTRVQVVTIVMNQSEGELDPYLTLIAPSGDTLAEDDDSGGEYNARISDFALYETGVYTIIAQGLNDTVGAYTLSLQSEERSAPELASLLVARGRDLVDQGNVDETLAVLGKAKELDPALETYRQLEMARLYYDVCRQASEQGNLSPVVMEGCQHAVTLVAATDDAYLNFNLCGHGTVVQLAAVVEPACDRARALAQPLTFGKLVTGTIESGSGGIWTFANTTVQAVTIAMNQAQNDLDAYLTLVGPAGNTLVEDDDSGGGRNARISDFVLSESGVYTIIAQGYGESTGAYTLSLKRTALSTAELASLFVERGRDYARQGQVEQAMTLLRQATELDHTLDIEPETEAENLAEAARLLASGRSLAQEGKIVEALAAYSDTQRLDPTFGISAEAWNTLCWFGTLYEHAPDVLSACEQAVALAPEDGNIRDSRGLARALTGDIEGAIEDFMFFVAWSKETGGGRNVAWREAWITALQAGQNPFDEAMLEALRNQ